MSASFAIKDYWIFILVSIFLIRAFFVFKKERRLQFARSEEAVHNKILPITKDIVLTILSSGFLVVASSYFLNKYLY